MSYSLEAAHNPPSPDHAPDIYTAFKKAKP